jgi:two-component sensor histidine kinase/CHASE3 domain sensor protein
MKEQKMPISSRAFVRSQVLFLVVGLLALSAIAIVGFWLGGRSSEISDELLAARDLKTEVTELRAAIQRAESSQRGYLYTSNEVYLAPYDRAKADAHAQLDVLPSMLATYPDFGPALERLRQVVDAKLAEIDETIALLRNRNPDAALDLVLTNRGKALTDEADVFITGMAQAADNRLSSLAREQGENASWQRLVAIVGALVAITAAAAALITIMRYAAELGAARDALSATNAQLESKVAARTADLSRSAEEMRAARDRAELLMHEVNHRVANSLAMVSSLVGLQAKATVDMGAKEALAETQSRINAVAMVHQRLYTSGDVAEVALDEYLRSVLDEFRSTMGADNRILLKYELAPVALKTDATLNLGVIAAEWVMNAAKYAYPDKTGEVRVSLSALPDGNAVLTVEDDGVGRGTGAAKGTGLGSRIVKAMATSISGDVEYLDRHPGFSARLSFPLVAA